MKSYLRSTLILAPLFVVGVLLLSANSAEATHFRYGSISWTQTENPGEVVFSGAMAWRHSAFGGSVGDIRGEGSLNFGDGSSASLCWQTVTLNSANDWLYGTIIGCDGNPLKHQYSGTGPYVVSWSSCCRISLQSSGNYHVNNPDGSERLETVVDLSVPANSSPRTTLPPINPCPREAVCTLGIPTTDPDRDALSFRLSTSGESSINRQPGPPNAPSAASIHPSTGVITWDTTGATVGPSDHHTLYSMQVMIEDGRTKTPVDFFIELVPEGVSPPTWEGGSGGGSSICDDDIVAPVGALMQFSIGASTTAPPPVTVSLQHFGLPPGATFTSTPPAQQVTGSFSWTPARSDVGDHLVVFSAEDSRGYSAGICSVVVTVVDLPTAIPVPDFCGPVGSVVTFDGTASTTTDLHGPIVSYTWNFPDGTFTGSTVTRTLSGSALVGTYPVSLTIQTATGYVDTAAVTVTVWDTFEATVEMTKDAYTMFERPSGVVRAETPCAAPLGDAPVQLKVAYKTGVASLDDALGSARTVYTVTGATDGAAEFWFEIPYLVAEQFGAPVGLVNPISGVLSFGTEYVATATVTPSPSTSAIGSDTFVVVPDRQFPLDAPPAAPTSTSSSAGGAGADAPTLDGEAGLQFSGPTDPILRPDQDGGRTFVAVLEDGVGGSYAYTPVNKEAVRDVLTALAGAGANVEPVIDMADVREAGAFVHEWSEGGVPFTTIGAYVISQSEGLLRIPAVIFENVAGTDGIMAAAASILADDLMPAANDATVPLMAWALPELEDQGAVNNCPADIPAYPSSGSAYSDHPEVFAWFARKTAADHEVWQGSYIERTGSDFGPTVDYTATQRIEMGLATRVDGNTIRAAGAYIQEDVSVDRSGDASTGDYRAQVLYTAGITGADMVDVPVASVRGIETRNDQTASSDSRMACRPDERTGEWSVGATVNGAFIPLIGTKTVVTHDAHDDFTNLGDPVREIETTRTTSLGAYDPAGDYVPAVGVRYWAERHTLQGYPLGMVAALQGLGDQRTGDFEMSIGVFDVDREFVPVSATRIDDDFADHHWDYRTMVSSGVYLLGEYQPLVGTTYDGKEPNLPWTLAQAFGDEDDRNEWQTSSGSFSLGFYRPVVGTRFVPETWSDAYVVQESYQVGVYPLDYIRFIPVASIDYYGERTSAFWAVSLALANQEAVATGPREGEWNTDLVVYTPGPYAFPMMGSHYRMTAPDAEYGTQMHVIIGVYVEEEFHPVAGASYSGSMTPGIHASRGALAAAGVSGQREQSTQVSVGAYDLGGNFVPLVTVWHDPADPSPRAGYEAHESVQVGDRKVVGVSVHGRHSNVVSSVQNGDITASIGYYDDNGNYHRVGEAGLRGARPHFG